MKVELKPKVKEIIQIETTKHINKIKSNKRLNIIKNDIIKFRDSYEDPIYFYNDSIFLCTVLTTFEYNKLIKSGFRAFMEDLISSLLAEFKIAKLIRIYDYTFDFLIGIHYTKVTKQQKREYRVLILNEIINVLNKIE